MSFEKKLEIKESQNIEYKSSFSDWNDIIRKVAGIASRSGGELIVGKKNDGSVIGVKPGGKTLRDLANEIRHRTDPSLRPSIVEDVEDGKKIVVIKISESKDKPVWVDGKPVINVADSTHDVGKSEYDRMVIEKYRKKKPWDGDVCEEASMDDIDPKKVEWYLEERYKARKVSKSELPYEKLLVNIDAVKNGKPTNAGILFFGKNPQRFFVQSPLRVVRFKGIDLTNPVSAKVDCSGTIWEMIEQAEIFIRDHIRYLHFRTPATFRRRDDFEYPIEALREAIINGLIHRNYNKNADTRVFIFDDRFEVISPGTFPKGVTPDSPKHEPVNPTLSNLVYDIGLIEKHGTGIAKMKRLSREWGNKEPSYDLHPVETKIIFESPAKEITFVDYEDVSRVLNERQNKALWYLAEHKKITRSDYAKLCECSARTSFRDLKDMVNKDIIKMRGVGRGTYYVLNDMKDGT